MKIYGSYLVAMFAAFALMFCNIAIAGERVLLCNRVELINPKGNVQNIQDRFLINLGSPKDQVLGDLKSSITYGQDNFEVNISVAEHEYIGTGKYVSRGMRVSSLVVDRASGVAWLAMADDVKGYSFIIRANCKIRSL